jgi:hypothetical protein
MMDGYPVGYWCPTYKDLFEVWQEMKSLLIDVTKEKSETVKQITIITGGKIDFWSMEDPDSGRGRFYKVAIIDEAEKAPKFEQAWKQAIRPTLADLQGDAWIMSTPKRPISYFNQLADYKEKYDNWQSWQMPTHANPHISRDELEETEKQLDYITWNQEYLANAISSADKPFMYCFEDRHIAPVELNPKDTIYLSFDFNVDPITCIVAQLGANFIHITHEIRLRNSNLYELCEHIRNSEWYHPHSHLIITGDASGSARHVTAKANQNNYSIIREQLHLGIQQVRVPKVNPPISESRTLCNSILAKHPNVFINSRCKYLIEDMRYVQVKDDGSIDKAADSHRAHLIDCFRYLLSTFKGGFIRPIANFKR